MSESHANGHVHAGRTFEVRVLRQDSPNDPSYWERHRLAYEADMNVTSVLQRIAAQAETIDGRKVAPVAYDSNCLEEVCGSCTMIINGRVRQACSALVDKLLAEQPDEIELQPMSKFPVVRDLCVNRRRLFRALEKVQAWIPLDSYYDMGPGPRQSQDEQKQEYPLSECMSCGCCLDACPQYAQIDVAQAAGETDAQFAARENAALRRQLRRRARHQPGDLLQRASDRPAECRRAAGRFDDPRRHPDLRQCAELRGRVPQAASR